ncbi:MAG TPA: UvrD-helicase domain-containing protein [bacterium]|nr:UvrD-helicase domain-containing protein [bacterium]
MSQPTAALETLLNPRQLEAVRHGDGPLLVLAGAGSGKTRVLTFRIASLIRERGVRPSSILAVTFTNKAAGEMRDRLTALLGPAAARALWIGTFHAICSRLLRISGAAAGVDPRFVIYDDGDQRTLMRETLRALDLDDRRFPPAAVLAEISRAKNELVDHVAYAARVETARQSMLAQIYAAYQRRLDDAHALDFDDLLLRAVQLLQNVPDVLARYQDRFRHILVDEYQDTNHAQYMLVGLLARGHRNLCVVGDDDQAIYRWRGADVRNILEFERDYPEARVVALEQNYRSTQRILAVAGGVISNNPHRHPKTLWTANPEGEPVGLYEAFDGYDEARHVGERIRAHQAAGGRFGDIAVLYRTHAQSRQFEEMFLRLGLPYQIVGGVRFYERAEIKDLLAYLRLASNPDDEAALRRVINVPRRGIGDATLRRLDAHARETGISLWEAVRTAARSDAAAGKAPSGVAGIGGALRTALAEFADIVQDLRAFAAAHTAREVLLRALDRTGYRRMLEAEGTDDAYARLENLEELGAVAQEVEALTGADAADMADGATAAGAGLETFLQHLALQTDADTFEERPDRVTLMTLHSAKGLEFPMVVLAGLEEGLFPHTRALEEEVDLAEERRLCYVGMTRARRRLLLTYAHQRTSYGTTRPSLPSRFLAEIPPDALVRETTPRTDTGEWPQEDQRPVPEVAVGDTVRHKTFGAGRVLEVDGEGPRAIITVRFNGPAGTKRLALGYAPLQRLSADGAPASGPQA